MNRFYDSWGTKILSVVLVLVILFITSLAEYSYAAAESADGYLAQGKSLFAAGEYGRSVEALSRAEGLLGSSEGKDRGRLAEVYFYLGLNFARQGNERLSKSYFKRAVQNSPGRAFKTALLDEDAKTAFALAVKELENESGPSAAGLPSADGGRKRIGAGWIVLAVVALAAVGVLGWYLYKEKHKPGPPDVTLSVQVHSDNNFDVIVDGVMVGNVYWMSTETYEVTPSTGLHSVLLRAKEWEDSKVTVKVTINNASDYKFTAAATTHGYWYEFSVTENEVSGWFWYDRGISTNTDFSFNYTISEK